MRRRLWAMALLMAVPWPACGAEPDAVGRLYENYVASAAAARTCQGVDPDHDAGFVANMQVVRSQALQHARQGSGMSDDTVRAMVERAGKGIDAGVVRFIADKGCANESVAHLLQMYRFHATSRPFERHGQP